MSLELNAIPSVETLNFYKELAEQEPYFKKKYNGYYNEERLSELSEMEAHNVYELKELFNYLIEAKEGSLEADVHFIQKSSEAIRKRIEEIARIGREIHTEIKMERDRKRKNKINSEPTGIVDTIATNPSFFKYPKLALAAEDLPRIANNRSEADNRNSEELYLDITQEMDRIVSDISSAANIKTIAQTGFRDEIAFIDESGVYRGSKNDIGYLTKEAKDHINSQIDDIRTKKTELIAAKSNYHNQQKQDKEIYDTLHPLTKKTTTNISNEIDEIHRKLEKLYEHVGAPSNVNKEIDVSTEIEKYNKKLIQLETDLETAKQILETPEEQQKLLRLKESRLLIEAALKEIEDILPKSISQSKYRRLRWERGQLEGGRRFSKLYTNFVIIDDVIKVLDEAERFWLEQKDKLKSCVIKVVEGGFDYKAIDNDKKDSMEKLEWHSPKAIIARHQAHTNELTTKISEYSHKLTDNRYDSLRRMVHDMSIYDQVDTHDEEKKIFDEKPSNTFSLNL